ncbi:MAG: hypothetical protein WCL08_00115 [Verrucomicrobiota bacterium]
MSAITVPVAITYAYYGGPSYWFVAAGQANLSHKFVGKSTPQTPEGDYSCTLTGPNGSDGHISVSVGAGGVITHIGGTPPSGTIGGGSVGTATYISAYEAKLVFVGTTLTPSIVPSLFNVMDYTEQEAKDLAVITAVPAQLISAQGTPTPGSHVLPSGPTGSSSVDGSYDAPTTGTDAYGTPQPPYVGVCEITLYTDAIPNPPLFPVTMTNSSTGPVDIFSNGSYVGTVPAGGVMSFDIPMTDGPGTYTIKGKYPCVYCPDFVDTIVYDPYSPTDPTITGDPYFIYIPPFTPDPDVNPIPNPDVPGSGNESNFQGCIAAPCVIPYLYTYQL